MDIVLPCIDINQESIIYKDIYHGCQNKKKNSQKIFRFLVLNVLLKLLIISYDTD